MKQDHNVANVHTLHQTKLKSKQKKRQDINDCAKPQVVEKCPNHRSKLQQDSSEESEDFDDKEYFP